MVREMIRPFEKGDLARVRRLDRGAAAELRFHEDLLPGSAHLALTGRVLAGVSYVLQGPGNFCHLVIHTRIRSGNGVDAVEALLETEIQWFKKYSASFSKKDRPVLRLWCKESDTAYLEFLKSFRFRERDRMAVYEKPLRDLKKQDFPAEIRQVDLLDPERMDAYINWTAEAYGMPDRAGEMRFKLRNGDGRVFAAFSAGEPVSFVTVWPLGPDIYATENIFTRREYQKQGHMEELLRAVFAKLRQEGAETLRLNVYENDAPAIRLYEKLGYRRTHTLLELWLSSR